MWNWLMNGGVEVDWIVGLAALALILTIAACVGYMDGYEDGQIRAAIDKAGEKYDV